MPEQVAQMETCPCCEGDRVFDDNPEGKVYRCDGCKGQGKVTLERAAELRADMKERLADLYDGDEPDERDRCDNCGGEGTISYLDHPEVWGEDCPSEVDHLVTCPECRGTGWLGR